MPIPNVLTVDLLNSFFFLYHNKSSDPIFSFIKDLKNVMQQLHIKKCILATDTGQSAYRLSKYPQYKETRREKRANAPEADKEALSVFFKDVDKFKQLAPMFGIEVASIKGVEADDLLSYISINSGTYKVANLSSDGDLLQLLSPTVIQRSYGPKMKLLDIDIPVGVWVTEARFKEVYELDTFQFMQYKALAGDTGDSIYSPSGLGSGTALKLMRKYGSLEEIYKNIDELDIPRFSAKARENLKKDWWMVERNVGLVSLLHTPETFKEIFGDGTKQLEDIKARIPDPPVLNEVAIQEWLFSAGKVNIYNDFGNWIKPFKGGS